VEDNANLYSINLNDFHMEFAMLSSPKDDPLKFLLIANYANILQKKD